MNENEIEKAAQKKDKINKFKKKTCKMIDEDEMDSLEEVAIFNPASIDMQKKSSRY